MSLKLVGRNTLTYAIGSVGQRVWSFLLIPLYLHALSIREYGLLSVLLVTIQILVVLMGTWIRDSYIRFAREYESRNQISELLGTSMLMIVITGALITTLGVTICTSAFEKAIHSKDTYYYILLCCLVAGAQSLSGQITSFYQARNEAFKYMIVGLVSGLLLLVLNAAFLEVLRLGIPGVLYAQLCAYTLTFVVVTYVVFSRIGMRVSLALVQPLLRFGAPLIVFLISALAMESSSTYFLSYLSGYEQVAIYTLGYKFAAITTMVMVLPFQLSYPPYIYANTDSSDIRRRIAKAVTYYFFISAYVVLSILFASRLILPLVAPPAYYSSYVVILTLTPALALYGLHIVGQTLLHINKKTYISGSVALGFGTMNIVLNLMLVPRYGLYGALLSTGLPFMLMGLMMVLLGKQEYSVHLERQRLATIGALMAIFVGVGAYLTNSPLIIVCVVMPLVACSSILYLSKTHFFDAQETRSIIGTIGLIRFRMI